MTYRIRVVGELDPTWMEWFDCMMIAYEDGITTITVEVADQSALFGLLDKILALNLVLISVNRCDTPEYQPWSELINEK
jgi:hypothetical protein